MRVIHERVYDEDLDIYNSSDFFRGKPYLNVDIIHCETQDEEMKLEHIKKVWDKYTCADVEKLLP